MNFNDFDKQEEIKMSLEEEKSHKKFFSRIGLSVFVYMLIFQFGSALVLVALGFVNKNLVDNETVVLIVSAAVQYLIAFPVLYFMLKPIPTSLPSDRRLSTREFIKALSIATFLIYMGQYISSLIIGAIESALGYTPENSISQAFNGNRFVVTLVIAIIAPIIEEIVFRKLLVDRLRPYGEKLAVFFPALIFALAHGNLYQLFYAFLIGVVLSYIYAKTGKIIYPILIHIFVNLFFGVLADYLSKTIDINQLLEYSYSGSLPVEYVESNMLSLTLLIIYGIVFYGLLFMGIFNFNRQLYKLRFEKGKYVFPKGKSLEITLFNAGTIAFITLCIILIAISTFSV